MSVYTHGLRIGAVALTLGLGAAQAASVPSDWTVTGTAGTLGADGNVALPAGETGYYYVTTEGGVYGAALDGVGGDGEGTTGSTVSTGVFSAVAGDALRFVFNYVTSDGSGFADYGWARLLSAAGDQVALLFTARTRPEGSVVPGFAMPEPTATLTPGEVPIIQTQSLWSVLGDSSGQCYNGPLAGCGQTGWIESIYEISATGDYRLEFGVTNWNDSAYQSGLAFAGARIGDVVITPPVDPAPVPLPAAGWLLLAGVGALGALRRKAARAA